MIDRVKTNGKAIASVFMILSLILIAVPADIGAQPSTHKVQRGDTLWSICEKYYGDANLWPKLWEMNPFVTNPHLLKLGDVIKLIEKGDIYKEKAAQEKPSKEAVKPAPKMKGMDLSLLTTFSTMGYLAMHDVQPWGEIYGSTKSELGAEKGDKVFLHLNVSANPGDEFRVARAIPVWHPLAHRGAITPPLGSVISVRGRVVVKEILQQDYYVAEVADVFAEFGVGAIILPFEPMSKCVQPIATDPKLYGNIIAAKDNMSVIGKNSVVYLNAGFKDGVHRGQVFEIVRISKIPRENLRVGDFEELMNDSFSSAVSKEEYLAVLWKKLTQGEITEYAFPVGRLIIVESRPDSSTAVVLAATEALTTGAFIKGFSWIEAPDFLTTLPSCPLE
jgi:LysM repeat protein